MGAMAVHYPSKVAVDLAAMLARGGGALSDLVTLRADPGAYGLVASDPTVSRMIAAFVGDAERMLAAIGSARQERRVTAWVLAGEHARCGGDRGSTVGDRFGRDVDHRAFGEEGREAHVQHGFGFHQLAAFADRGPAGAEEMFTIKLRPGNAASHTTADPTAVCQNSTRLTAPAAAESGEERRDGKGCFWVGGCPPNGLYTRPGRRE